MLSSATHNLVTSTGPHSGASHHRGFIAPELLIVTRCRTSGGKITLDKHPAVRHRPGATGAIAVVNDGTVMPRSKRRERAEATVTRLRPISPWLLLLAVVAIVAVTWPLTHWLYGVAGDDPARRIEAIKTGLTVAAGTGGAFALLLAFRRQLATEIIATETQEVQEREYEQRDRAADASERDAEQRRITELYTKAADQLGSDKTPVRLAGLHALERLAQNTPDQRQTIVDVICAYLRMPYKSSDGQPPAEDAPAEAHTRYEEWRQELQVRLTAQRILVAHLRPGAVDTFWPDIDLDLTEAHSTGSI